ncbi:hypothetical protein FF36_00426 [Frankia torreyi]|uniref:Uncharacterized protein n=1 Tax=Frankia torreyi TaxID=1856 RepID=A0A0D8BM44_9ACTN|nr:MULTISPECIES: hypothetical protein [Frankia]KJE25293.1 hypothetical protein FF36_00426 [Frankia torreyi]KQC37200.1 hypothetical protein UK82_17360 [Frankia sp. ACN1ag]
MTDTEFSAAQLGILARDPVPAGSSVDGQIQRSEILGRAQFWVNHKVTYTQSASAPDPRGRRYRRDCSGLVSMAWHLSSSRTTYTFASWSGKIRLSSLHDLRPGDALLRSEHIELFVKWKNKANHAAGAYVYSFNHTGETVENPTAPTNQGRIGFDTWSELSTYTPIRYRKAVNAPRPTLLAARSAGSAGSPPPNSDGSLVREPDGGINLIVGGVPFELEPAEYAALGSPQVRDIPADTLEDMPELMRDGTIVATGDGTRFLIAGNAKYRLTPADWDALGKPSSVTVPARLVDVLDVVPIDDTFLRDAATHTVWQILGAAKYPLTQAEYTSLGSPAHVDVPAGFLDAVASRTPVGSYFLRDPLSAIVYQVVAGAEHPLSAAEYAALGQPDVIDAPLGFVMTLGPVPREHTYLTRNSDGEIFEVRDGTRRALTADEAAALGEVDCPTVADGFLDAIPNA